MEKPSASAVLCRQLRPARNLSYSMYETTTIRSDNAITCKTPMPHFPDLAIYWKN